MTEKINSEARDLTRMNVPLLKAASVVIFVCTLVWWARGLQSSVEGMARDLTTLSAQVGEVVKVQSEVSSNRREIESMRRELTSLRDDYKVLQLKYERLDKDFAVATARQGD